MNSKDAGEEDAAVAREEDHVLFNQFAAHFDAPAYVRRAQRVEEGFALLVERCRIWRDEHLEMVRVRLALLHALAGEWEVLNPCLADGDQLRVLKSLHADLKPRLQHPIAATTSERTLKRALRELIESIERFNQRWREFLRTLDLGPLNALRDGYNRYYLLEKECAVRSPRVARQGFRRLEPLTLAELETLLPVLGVPRLRA
ncbi:MAG: hypothetical protein K2R98_29535 [Gemmataceae bacterium]|nr:hypothetical protein [Gemmataceae bacterium]